MKVKPKDLTARQGKILRYVCSYTPDTDIRTHAPNVLPAMCIFNNAVETDLPHTVMQARATLNKLQDLDLVKKVGKGYEPLPAGQAIVKAANQQGIWRSVRD